MNKKSTLFPYFFRRIWGGNTINLLKEGFQLTQKQCLIVNEMLLVPTDAIFIKVNMKKDNLRNKKI